MVHKNTCYDISNDDEELEFYVKAIEPKDRIAFGFARTLDKTTETWSELELVCFEFTNEPGGTVTFKPVKYEAISKHNDEDDQC